MQFFNDILLGSIDESWKLIFEEEFQKNYFQKLSQFLYNDEKSGKIIFPAKDEIFNIFKLVPLQQVKVVIIGQDPYHGIDQANGLAFSVSNRGKLPPSLQNIFKEIKNNFPHYDIPRNGCLIHWAKQGVFLLNSVLSVEKQKPGSHSHRGWEEFTDKIVSLLNESNHSIIFLLWGRYAKEKANKIDPKKHFILESPHPSPFSAHKGFMGNQHFLKCNNHLIQMGSTPINWSDETFETLTKSHQAFFSP